MQTTLILVGLTMVGCAVRWIQIKTVRSRRRQRRTERQRRRTYTWRLRRSLFTKGAKRLTYQPPEK